MCPAHSPSWIFEDAGKDQGANVREKARQLLDLLNNEEALNQERDKARAAKNKFGGVSSHEAGHMGPKTTCPLQFCKQQLPKALHPDTGELGWLLGARIRKASVGGLARCRNSLVSARRRFHQSPPSQPPLPSLSRPTHQIFIPRSDDPKPGFSDDDFKFAAERGRKATQAQQVDAFGLTSMVSSMYSQASEYATAASKQLQSMQTLFPSNELDKKLTEALSNEPDMPSSSLLYELGRATHREDDYRIILSAIWQNVLRSNQRPRVVSNAHLSRCADALSLAGGCVALRGSRGMCALWGPAP